MNFVGSSVCSCHLFRRREASSSSGNTQIKFAFIRVRFCTQQVENQLGEEGLKGWVDTLSVSEVNMA